MVGNGNFSYKLDFVRHFHSHWHREFRTGRAYLSNSGQRSDGSKEFISSSTHLVDLVDSKTVRPTIGIIGVVLSSPYGWPFDLLGEFTELSDLVMSGVELTARLYSIWEDRL